MAMRTCLGYFWVYPRALLALIWEVVFWPLINRDSHKLRPIRKIYWRILWFCRNFLLRSRRGQLSPITLKTCSLYLYFEVYPCSLLKWIWEVEFFPTLVLFYCYTYLSVCMSVIQSINDIPGKPSLKGSMAMWTYFRYLGVSPRALLISIWEVVVWTVAKSNSHKLRQVRKLYCHNLWFVAICDQGRDGKASVKYISRWEIWKFPSWINLINFVLNIIFHHMYSLYVSVSLCYDIHIYAPAFINCSE